MTKKAETIKQEVNRISQVKVCLDEAMLIMIDHYEEKPTNESYTIINQISVLLRELKKIE